MVTPNSATQAEDALERFLRRSDAMIQCKDAAGRRAMRDLLETLAAADASLSRRLRYWVRMRGGGGAMRFSEASLVAYRAQVQTVIELVKARLQGITNEASLRAARESLRLQAGLFERLEGAFTGVVRPLQIDAAAMARLRPSLLARHATSVDRYGNAMVNKMERIISQGLAEGITQSQMTDRLVAIDGPRGVVSLRAYETPTGKVIRLQEEFIPEGLFVRHRQWAQRIVRTEVAEAQNAAADEAIDEAQAVFRSPMKRKILAIMDDKVGMDSLGVHGQVRAKDELFLDGAGRRYLRPPARPNDRETIIPWRDRWSETNTTRPIPASEQQARYDEAQERTRASRNRRARLQRIRQARIDREMRERFGGPILSG